MAVSFITITTNNHQRKRLPIGFGSNDRKVASLPEKFVCEATNPHNGVPKVNPEGVALREELAQLERERELSLDKKNKIELELTNQNVTDKSGQRLGEVEWNTWRIRAKTALNYTIKELRRTNARIKEVNRALHTEVDVCPNCGYQLWEEVPAASHG